MYQSTHTGAQVDEAVDKALSADAVPTPGSTNLVESGGVFGVVSNRNLLDNPFFTVNQRGASGYTSVGYTFDRWRILVSGYSVAYNEDGSICITKSSGATGQFAQYFEWDDKVSTFTFTLMSPDGTTYTRTGNYTNTGYTAYTSPDGLVFRLYMDVSDGFLRVNIYSTAAQTGTLNIKAVKLEKGTVSTLANDSPPNYAEELAKCQRYFYRYSGLTSACTVAGTTVSAITIPFPCTMRGVPAISNVTYYDSKVAEGRGTYVSGARFYNSSNVGFSVTGFDVSADL